MGRHDKDDGDHDRSSESDSSIARKSSSRRKRHEDADERRRDRKRHRKEDRREDRKEDRKDRKSDRKSDRREDRKEDRKDRKSRSSKRSSSSSRRRRRHRRYDDDDTDSDADDGRRDGGHRQKSHRREKTKRSRSNQRNDNDKHPKMSQKDRNYELADALLDLLSQHPNFATELPILLIRLASGASLDFTNMSNSQAAKGMERVLQCLQPFGVVAVERRWTWQAAAAAPRTSKVDERILLRIVRTLLDDIGLTAAAAAAATTKAPVPPTTTSSSSTNISTVQQEDTSDGADIRSMVRSILTQFANTTLATELVGLCKVLLQGENVALDGLPNPELRQALENLFIQCQLEKSEIEDDDSEKDDNDESSSSSSSTIMGYGLSLDNDHLNQLARSNLGHVLETCQKSTITARKKGPMPQPANFTESLEDEEGPATLDQITFERLAQAKRRAEQIQREKDINNTNQREEWMLIPPTKFDLLSYIQSKPMKSRSFKSKLNEDEEDTAVDANIQAEIHAIRQVHQDSRGPSLMDQHRAAKQEKKQQETTTWKWNREADLDAGRRVDKNALNMVFGGASEDLKKKFQSGF